MNPLETLERLRPFRERVELLERKPPRELVASFDIIRTDALGRQVVACPAGKVPPHWLQLTSNEQDSLVVPPEPAPDGTLEPGHCGFTPKGVVMGGYVESDGGTW